MTDYRYARANGWRWVGYFLRHGRPMAALRQAWLAYVRGYIGETCERCGREYFLWHAPDQLWAEVTGHRSADTELAGGLWCPPCFDRRATSLGLNLRWTPSVIGGQG